MTNKDSKAITALIEKIRVLVERDSAEDYYHAASLAQSVLFNMVGPGHPLMSALQADWQRARAASRSVVALHDEGALESPRLAIAHEIEGDLLDIAQSRVQIAEVDADPVHRQIQLAIAAFLGGAALEDALRRLCDVAGLAYEAQRTTISKLQSLLFQPSNQIEIITGSENKQITAWGDTRNKADHGRFADITHAEVLAMVIGVRAFVDKHLP